MAADQPSDSMLPGAPKPREEVLSCLQTPGTVDAAAPDHPRGSPRIPAAAAGPAPPEPAPIPRLAKADEAALAMTPPPAAADLWERSCWVRSAAAVDCVMGG